MSTYIQKTHIHIALAVIATSIFGISFVKAQATGTNMTIVPSGATTSVIVTTSSTTTEQLPDYRNRAVVEAKVRSSFANVPVMIAIADCESKFRQFDSTGAPLDGGAGGMIGIFQVHGGVHRAFALTQGFDINTVEGNIGYAKYLYEHEGTNPWISSFPCWSASTTNPESSSSPLVTPTSISSPQLMTTNMNLSNSSLTARLSFGMTHPQVIVLQQILNSTGYTIASTGPGSNGNETTKFGSLTRDSVRRFQCAKGIVCSGDEASTGYGYVGARTRQALIASIQGGSVTTNTNGTVTPSTQAATDKAKKIQDLEAKLQEQMKIVNDIQSELTKLKSN